jgi:arabinose-5-phosphate isomerase
MTPQADSASKPVSKPAPQIDVIAEVKRVLELEGKSILDCMKRLSGKDSADSLAKAIEHFHLALERGGKIIVTGIGKSGKVGQKIAATLCSTGSLAVFLHPTEGLHGDLGVISPQDAVLALSYTGNTEELIRLLPSIQSLRVPVIGLGGNAQSKLALGCNAWIDAAVDQEACPHNLAPTTSTTLALALGDAIAVALMQLRGFKPEAFAKFHPGGSLGRRLNWKVSDIMHQGDAVPTLPPSATMDQVVMALTTQPLGAALVVEEGKLLGIIADGDIRRALQHRQKFFGFQAKDVMTQRPVTATPDLMAVEALELMENRPKQITVLPVVDGQGNWKGLVRLHDIIRSF